MNTLRNKAFALLTGLTIATLGAFAFASDSDVDDESDTGSDDKQACTLSSGTSPTGREWGDVSPSPLEPGVCLRRRLGGDAPVGAPHCHKVAQLVFACTEVRDI